MSRNGSGTYSLPAGNPVTTGTTISSTWANNTLTDIATALTQSIASDGQTTPTANLPMGGFKLTGLGAGSAATDSVRLGQVQAGSATLLSSVAGTNTITATASPTLTAYASGNQFVFVPAGANTGATTINVDSVGAKNLFAGGAACVGGELQASQPALIEYDGTQFNLISPNLSQGRWTTPTYSAGTYTASGSMTWTVDSGDVTNFQYTIINKTMTVNFKLDSTSVGGTPSTQLIITIPASKVAAKNQLVPVIIRDSGTVQAGYCFVGASGTQIIINLMAGGNFATSTNATNVQGSITFEIT